MGQHKTNPTAILAKEGKLPPKEKLTKWTNEELTQLVSQFVFKKIIKGETK
jgi:hypothetical protein